MTVRQRQRAGGRSEQVRLAVGRAVHDLLAEGRFPFTTVEVAERAGVNRRTLYRWWPTQDLLLAEALTHHVRLVEVPDTGSWAEDVRLFAHRVAGFAADPVDVSITRIMASRLHPDFNAAVEEHFAPVVAGWEQMLARAVARGDAAPVHRADTVVSALVSPLFLAPLTRGAPAAPETVDRIVDLVLDATRPRA
ncbi:TetR/AcrR family transcriptional regulator C-terminal ligand-binding domain-containing protein [Nocardioides sp. SOB77]|uniref:TetR/AcrR family transcriptional regulator C-terminal ligand-binding domain-containing protein n=1 Tax=Nocardioides oceani TaxID=3058369 RepID=A0ABT8FBU8_9ACTN|nr:TetR/AcrR family transcriptional regulator [Nocardioides oceani]MDN4172171.1 TetR/AcrR family transcriptional regulator C-terminal ligand-binding domain-containing protein [Nocardioides oceani]